MRIEATELRGVWHFVPGTGTECQREAGMRRVPRGVPPPGARGRGGGAAGWWHRERLGPRRAVRAP